MVMSLPSLKVAVFVICLCFKMVSFRGQKKGWATPRLISFRGLIQNFPRPSPPLSYWSPPSPGVSTFQMVGEHFSFHRSYSKIRLLYSLKELHVLSYLVGVQTVVDCEQSLFFFRFSEERVSRISLDGLRPKRDCS